ncbi:MAG TPA: hypothetical protein ENG42_03445 [Candidatus Aenigmarchaeota archaeon]|nr:MAG: hypothetical protein DRP03_02215 [Candidatus Aenigmarchaeota archaeon]HDD46506.1 hypothetical protein [Candidatus Aenigmarchaeota archaeon]
MNRAKIIKWMEQRFGINRGIFKGYAFIIKNGKVWLTSREVMNRELRGIKIESVGLLFGRYSERKGIFKPTTNALQIFGKYASRNIVELNERERDDYLTGYDLEKQCDAGEGYVIIKYKHHVLGCGLYRNGIIKNQIPKARRRYSVEEV